MNLDRFQWPGKRAVCVFAIVATSLTWHAFSLRDSWTRAAQSSHGRDFASYFYAARAAVDGGDPYDSEALSALARADGTRSKVHPYLYPPPFLLTMMWTLPLELDVAYRLWFWISELFLWLTALALWRWWRPIGSMVPVAVVAAIGIGHVVTQNHLMGQANIVVLLLTIAGLWQAESRRPILGGALVGVACMIKMSPALLVAWWLLRRKWTAIAAAVGTATLLVLCSLPLGNGAPVVQFFSRVLPGLLGSGSTQLSVPIGLFGNHSLPNLFHHAFPGAPTALSPPAIALSITAAVGLVAALGISLRRAPDDTLATAGHVSAVLVAMLLIPIYTYGHHLVWALPAVVATVMALLNRRLSYWWILPTALAVVAWAVDPRLLRELAALGHDFHPIVATALRESKTAALAMLLVASVVVGRSHGGTLGN